MCDMVKFIGRFLKRYVSRDIQSIIADYIGEICISVMDIEGLMFPLYILTDKFNDVHHMVMDGDDVYSYTFDGTNIIYTHLNDLRTYTIPYECQHAIHDKMLVKVNVDGTCLRLASESKDCTHEYEYEFERKNGDKSGDVIPLLTGDFGNDELYVRLMDIHDNTFYYKVGRGMILKPVGVPVKTQRIYLCNGNEYIMKMGVHESGLNTLHVTIWRIGYPSKTITKTIHFPYGIMLSIASEYLILIDISNKRYSIKSKQEIFTHLVGRDGDGGVIGRTPTMDTGCVCL